jgi:hypothetical protein
MQRCKRENKEMLKRKCKGEDCKVEKIKTAREQSSEKSSWKREKDDWTIPEIEGGKL